MAAITGHRIASGATTLITPTPAHRMATTGPAGLWAAALSASDRGTAGAIAMAGAMVARAAADTAIAAVTAIVAATVAIVAATAVIVAATADITAAWRRGAEQAHRMVGSAAAASTVVEAAGSTAVVEDSTVVAEVPMAAVATDKPK